jgi:signal transduction histidine kinase/CheY-like chemotaxis protein
MIARSRIMKKPVALGREHVVVCVDDDPSILTALRRALRGEPYDLRTVQKPEEALDLVAGGKVSLLLSDHRMPGMTGADLMREVRERSPGTVRVVLTAYPGSPTIGHGLESGIDWLISKPWNDEALRLTLRQLLSEREKSGTRRKKSDRAVGADLRHEIVERLGYVPPLFEPAAEAPAVLEGLWRQATLFYLDNPLPRLFKEKLFAYLSRFCAAPYGLIVHSCALRAEGLSAPEIFSLLEEPPPAIEVDVAAHLSILESSPVPIEAWPGAGSPLERGLFRCSVALFLSGASSGRCRSELRRLLGPAAYAHLLGLLGYIRTVHAWTEAHPDLSPSGDRNVADHLDLLLREEPRLCGFFEQHAERVRRERSRVEDKLLDVIAGLQKRESELQAAQDRLELRVQERTAELTALNEQLRRDIAERRRAEEERDRLSESLLQGQKLQALGQLAAGIAHEINNPVGYILSNLGSIRDYLGDLRGLLEAALEAARSVGPEDEARKALDRVRDRIDAPFLLEDFGKAVDETRQGAERIRDIVRSLREFSHVDDGEIRPSDLNEILENSLRLCWNELKYKAEVRRDYGDLPALPCHAQRLSQVFVNLLVNAAQAIAERGAIEVSTRLEGGDAVVSVRDSGCGMSEEVIPRIFDPFFTTKPVGMGTGLGLHVAYKIVSSHGGKIEVRSQPGKGSEFEVRLPLAGPPGMCRSGGPA